MKSILNFKRNLEMNSFEVGDKVIRTSQGLNGVVRGEEYIVKWTNRGCMAMKLMGVHTPFTFSPNGFELVGDEIFDDEFLDSLKTHQASLAHMAYCGVRGQSYGDCSFYQGNGLGECRHYSCENNTSVCECSDIHKELIRDVVLETLRDMKVSLKIN